MYNSSEPWMGKCICFPFSFNWRAYPRPTISQQITTSQDLEQFIVELQNHIPISYTTNNVFEGADGQIFIFTDQLGRKFVLKTVEPEADPWEKYSLVRETVGSRIAEEMNLPIDRVRMIPSNVQFGLKPENVPATLHTFVEGENDIPIGIQQNIAAGGLNYTVIKNMSKSPDLSKIAALDTFLGNPDRHDWNVFKLGDHYTGIDMGDSFAQPLASFALEQLRDLQQKGVQFTPQEIAGLRVYRDTLEELIRNYSPQKVSDYFREATLQSGLRGPENFDKEKVHELLRVAKENINASRSMLEELNSI